MESNIFLYSLISVVAVSLISLIALVFLSISKSRLKRITFFLVSLAAGTLVGDAFIHLIPEATEVLGANQTALLVLGGIVFFFILEKILLWHHDHHTSHEHCDHRIGQMNLIGDGLHNLIDGILIGASYLVSIPLGVATTIAVFLHEIPQEVGDFGVLIHSGYTRRQALFWNFISGLVAVAGLILTVLIGQEVTAFAEYVVPLAAGSFIYIGLTDLIPELNQGRKNGIKLATFQLIGLVLGMGIMQALSIFE
ncbi:MAG: ZIP family metal transporter [Candidatus Yanofskybacteria bacterium CG10_big_fil_rev_8_21_14_0_10_46_23]|uniref:ZIP family metal transporter n=1 Tax=Candidatus Yanofskybacteria bacterium CG10_big_fil_rev_8_21_14_0_10_46_23 TaxID=1975098 RepID=A0A2H0R4L0_9BACT|nr:MAG: ZIP family metal transporter [Candidatus Yanofskybacteria bacterium CG10_big_fil_rev_8_21_14_0_10_46_23]